MTKDKILELIEKLLKYGFSSVMATAGVVLIYLGSVGNAPIPESYYMGAGILGFSCIFMINETILKIIKFNRKNKNEKKLSFRK